MLSLFPPIPRPLRHPLRLVAAAVLTAALLLSPALADLSAAANPVPRIHDSGRVSTAVAVARTAWGHAPHVILTTAIDFPDAVAGAALASTADAPVLLTPPDHLAPAVSDALRDLGTTTVTIIGGPAAVWPEVEQALRDSGYEVERVAGVNRYDTAADLAAEVAGEEGRVPVIALAVGERGDGHDAWPDALSSASLAGLPTPVPTLLTKPGELPGDTRAAIEQLRPARVLVLGGPEAIFDSVANEIAATGIAVERVFGQDRYATSVEVARRANNGLEGSPGLAGHHAVFVSGEDFPDALAAGALAARRDAALLLVPEERLADGTDAFVREPQPDVQTGDLIGGPAAVTQHVEAELDAAVSGAERPPPPPPPCPPNSSPDCAYTYEHPIETWERLAQCESGGNWQLSSGNGYYGGLQFSLGSWRGVGGTHYPHWHSKWEQIYRGELLQDRQGWGAWPSCSRRMGLR